MTSPIGAPSPKIVLKVYPIGDLLVDQDQSTSASVVRIIQATIVPLSWQAQGGEGVVEFFEAKKALIVRQTPDVHQQLSELLELLRDKPTAPPPGRKK